jgi:molybdenum cofactor cytidylyltransferase
MFPANNHLRLFAIVPAAGHSRRMGRPKLLLPLGASTVIARMLSILKRPEIAATIVVVRPDDEPLRAAVAECGAIPLQPENPPAAMRHSVEEALRYLQRQFRPRPEEAWLLAPADHPLLDPAVIDRLVAAWRSAPERIVVPACRGKRGHPTLFPFRLAFEVFALPPDQGLNSLLQRHATEIEQVEIDSPAIIGDLDTPEDYARVLEELVRQTGQAVETSGGSDSTPAV